MKLFGKEISFAPKPQPTAPAPVYVRSESAALGEMVDAEIARMKREVQPVRPVVPEDQRVNMEADIRRELANAARDQRVIAKAKAETEQRRRAEEKATNKELMRQIPPAKDDGEFATYEPYTPNFV